jgi:hypothetical protein
LTDTWVRIAGEWEGTTNSGSNPPPDPQPRFAGHEVNRIILGFANAETGTSQLTYNTAIGFTGTIYERRKFTGDWVTASYINTWLNTCGAAGQLPWLSFKVPNNNWAGVPLGQYDAGLDIILERAEARPEAWIVSVHHEPDGDGTLSVWAEMQEYISNYLAPMSHKVAFAPIGNGFWFGPNQYAPAKIADAFPASLIAALNANNHLLAVDSYDSADATKLSYSLYDRTSLKIQGFIDWCRSNGVNTIGWGEFGCHTGEDVRRCWNIFADNCDLVGVANYFNSGANSRANWLLVPSTYIAPDPEFNGTAESQSRLDYFKDALLESVNANPGQVAP